MSQETQDGPKRSRPRVSAEVCDEVSGYDVSGTLLLSHTMTVQCLYRWQNIFHRLLWTGLESIRETYGGSLTPIHKLFRSLGEPIWDGWQAAHSPPGNCHGPRRAANSAATRSRDIVTEKGKRIARPPGRATSWQGGAKTEEGVIGGGNN